MLGDVLKVVETWRGCSIQGGKSIHGDVRHQGSKIYSYFDHSSLEKKEFLGDAFLTIFQPSYVISERSYFSFSKLNFYFMRESYFSLACFHISVERLMAFTEKLLSS